jgi:hypothetical protein
MSHSNPLTYSLAHELTQQSQVMSASLSWCQTASGAQDQIFVTVRQLRVSSRGAPSLTRGRIRCLQLLVALASADIFIPVKIRSTSYLHLQFYSYMSAFLMVSCQGSGYLWTSNIYSFICKSRIYVGAIYTSLGIADHAGTHAAHVITAT